MEAILTLINQCKTELVLLAVTNPDTQVFAMLYGTSLKTNLIMQNCYGKNFTQGDSRHFFSHRASHKASLKNPKKKVTPLLIPYGRFSKFVPKGETVEVFGMVIPDPLITEAIQQSSFYPKYLEMVAMNTKKTPQESASKQPATRRTPPKKPTTTTPFKHAKSLRLRQRNQSNIGFHRKLEKRKAHFSNFLMKKMKLNKICSSRQGDDPDLELLRNDLEAHQKREKEKVDLADMERAIKLSLDPAILPQGQAPVGGVTIRDPVSKTTPKLLEVVGKGKAIVTEEQVAHSLIDMSKKKRTTDQFILVRQAAAPKGGKDQGEVDLSTVISGVSIPVSDPEKTHKALAGPDLEPMQEDQTGSNSGKLHVSLAGPNPEHMDDEFLATAYPKFIKT
ncbi:hypothetical protein Tco_0322963 [Tanacetum coccineum]